MSSSISMPPLSSGGIILSYQCTNTCRHCLYACSPGHRDWMCLEDQDSLYTGIPLDDKPLLRHVFNGGVESLYQWVMEEHGYEERQDGYIAKCHLCLDIRTYLVKRGVKLKELQPLEFYENL